MPTPLGLGLGLGLGLAHLAAADADEVLEEADDGAVSLTLLHMQPGAPAVECGHEDIALEQQRRQLLEHLLS